MEKAIKSSSKNFSIYPSENFNGISQFTEEEIGEVLQDLSSIAQEIPVVDDFRTPKESKEFAFKDPPDLNEILKTEESLIISTSHNVRILNSACQLILKEMEYQLVKLLKQNRKEQETVLGFLSSKGKIINSEGSSKCASLKCAGMPFFKDKNGFFSPDNADVVKKKKHNQLLPCDFIEVVPAWTLGDTKNLMKSVKSYLEKSLLNDNESIDWLKISATDMKGKFSPVECKSKWMLHLKQGINRSKWRLKEIKTLNEFAKKNNYQNWDEIAEELGNNRTALQCCVKYQSQTVSHAGKWTKEEDEKLKLLINIHKVKDYVPWAKVAWYFEDRSLRQCQERHCYHLCKIKKGPFSLEEDFVLVYLSTKLKNFGQVAKYLPNRVSTQIRARYEYLVKLAMPKFNKEEDELLTKLVAKYPRRWGKISEAFKNRSRLQCRRRWQELQRDIKLEDNLSSESEAEESAISIGSNIKERQADNLNLKIKLPLLSRVEIKKVAYSPEYFQLLQYFSHCHKFLFGPKPKVPSTSKDNKYQYKRLRIMMNNLSVCPGAPLNNIDPMQIKNSEFDSEDLFLLKRLEHSRNSGTGLQISDKIFPPNYMTLVGLRSLFLGRSKIKNQSSSHEPVKETRSDLETRLLFTDAKRLFQLRIKALFAFPLILSLINQEGMNLTQTYKPKVRKGVKKISKLRRKEHAKLMYEAYRNKYGKKIIKKLKGDLLEKEDGENVESCEKEKKTKKRSKKEASDEHNNEILEKKPRKSI